MQVTLKIRDVAPLVVPPVRVQFAIMSLRGTDRGALVGMVLKREYLEGV